LGFTYTGVIYKYFYHTYNATWRNERTVEIPIIWRMVKEHKGKNILEIGNVLSHYYIVGYDIVDKGEKAKGVINEDANNYKTEKQYDLIISISTFEHIGWDEYPRDTLKIFQVIENLTKSLKPKGKMVITLPIGFNTVLDQQIDENKLKFTRIVCLKRTTTDNAWIESNWEDIRRNKYNYPFPNANGLVIGIIEKTDVSS